MVNWMGVGETASDAGTERLRSVRVDWTSLKSVIRPGPREGNSAYSGGRGSDGVGGVWTRVSSMGRRVTMLLPLQESK